MKLLCVLLPHFPLRCEFLRGRYSSGRPAVVTTTLGSEKLILDYFPDLPGLQVGLSLQQALAVQGGLEVIHADTRHYQSVFNKLLDGLELKSPLVEGAELGTAYLGLAGLESLYGSDEALACAVRQVLPAAFEPLIGIAAGKFPARLAALHSPPGGCRVLAGDIAGFLQDLSCDLLPVSLKIRLRLHDFGLHTLGRLAGMSPVHLQAQFGPEGQLMWQLACGQDDTPLYSRFSQELIEDSTVLLAPTVSLDLILMALETMLARVFMRLSQKNLGVSRITVWTRSWTAEHWEETVRFKEAAMNPGVVLARVRQTLETAAQPGPVEELGLKVTGTGRLTSRQKSLLAQVRAREHLLDEIKQLEFRLGSPRLFRLKEVEPWSRVPERRYTMASLNH